MLETSATWEAAISKSDSAENKSSAVKRSTLIIRPIQADGDGRRENSGRNSGACAVLAKLVVAGEYHASLGGRCRHRMGRVLVHTERGLPALHPVSHCTRLRARRLEYFCTSTYIS